MERLYKKLKSYGQSDYYPFHMPGHKRNRASSADDFLFERDITEISGFDNLHHAEGILKEAQEYAAQIYGTKKCFFSVNGSTAALLAAVSASVNKGGKILVARNCHKAVYHALYLRELQPVYIYPHEDQRLGINGGISPERVERYLEENTDVQAFLLTSPTYDGVVSDIKTIAEVVHRHKIPLIVDEAHGAHLPYANHGANQEETCLPYSAVREGADIVIQSLHKTLPCLTQSAAFHICSDRVSVKKIERALHIFETSSPSYVLMAGMDLCVRYMQGEGKKKLQMLTDRLQLFYERSESWKQLWFLYPKIKSADMIGIPIADYTKIVFGAKGYKNAGRKLHEILRDRYHLQPEMSAPDYVILMTMLTDTEEGFLRLEAALSEINDELECGSLVWERTTSAYPSAFVPLELVMLPLEAAEAPVIQVPFFESVGKISAETVYVYPPGCPFLMPGEKISEELLEIVRYYRTSGMELYGMEDETGETLLVIEN